MSGEGRLGLIAGGLVAAILAWVWLGGGFAGWAFGDGWVSLPAAELLATAARLPFHLGDPRGAWPAAAQVTLPRAVGVYLAFGLVGIGLSGVSYLLLGATRALGIQLMSGTAKGPPSARWASRRELGVLAVGSAQPGRLTLGRGGGQLLAAEERQSVIVVAPSQSGKTMGLAIPALLEWQGPVLATSIKGDLLADSLVRREALGEVMIFDPTQVTGREPTRATPLQSCRTLAGIDAGRPLAGGLGAGGKRRPEATPSSGIRRRRSCWRHCSSRLRPALADDGGGGALARPRAGGERGRGVRAAGGDGV